MKLEMDGWMDYLPKKGIKDESKQDIITKIVWLLFQILLLNFLHTHLILSTGIINSFII
jgi:hypothetical protein